MKQRRWMTFSDEALLRLRIRDLHFKIEEAEFYPHVQRLLRELKETGLHFQPRIYLGDEWFSPDGVVAVAVPFFLAHPRLKALERSMMMEVEGDGPEEFARFFRHELGHAFDHAFRLSRAKTWAEIFGSPKKEYHPETYRPRPYSRNFVSNITRWYAQAHPDEDFAETFAVWLDPESDWKRKYKKWGAYKKLLYIDQLAELHRHKVKARPEGRMISDAQTLSSTLDNYYRRKRKVFAEDYPDFYDKDLLRIFARPNDWPSGSKAEKAHLFMKRHRRQIIDSVAHWTKERKVVIDDVVSDLVTRCTQLGLVLKRNEAETLIEASGYLATMVSNYLFTGHFKRTV